MRTASYFVSTASYGKVIYNIGENGAKKVKCGAHLECPLRQSQRQQPLASALSVVGYVGVIVTVCKVVSFPCKSEFCLSLSEILNKLSFQFPMFGGL